jgi:quercetin dioxygenase-like cupin family protein
VLDSARDTDARGIVVHPWDLHWELAAAAGVTVKYLFAEPGAGRRTTLVRLAPRTRWMVDDADADHELYVVEGRVTLGDGEVGAGEYALAGRFEGMAGDEGCTVVLARSNLEAPGHRAPTVVRPAEQEWRPGGTPGVAVKRLVGDPARRAVTALVRMDAGARLRSHRHVTPERFYMLAGDLHVSGHEMGPGAFCAAGADTIHDGTFSRSGCEFLLISTEVELLSESTP